MIRRRVENVVIGAISGLHVALCRWLLSRPTTTRNEAPDGPLLVIRCEAKMGDNLLNVPFLRALRHAFPRREIHLLHHRAARAVYADCPYIDRRIEIDWTMSAPATLLRRLGASARVYTGREPRVGYAAAVVPRWDEDLYAPFLAWFSGAPRRVGFSRRVLPEKAVRNFGIDTLFTDIVHGETIEHEARRPMQLLHALGADDSEASARLEFWFSPGDVAHAAGLLGALGAAQWVAIAPGAAIGRRQWPTARFAALADTLARRFGLRIALLGSAAESGDCDLIAAATGGAAINLAGRLSLAQCAAVLSHCRLFLGNDSGLAHLASACSVVTVEVSCHPLGAPGFHANAPDRFGPTSPGSVVLRPERPLSPACRHGCEQTQAHCITLVPQEAVLAAVSSLLSGPREAPAATLPLPTLGSGSIQAGQHRHTAPTR